MNILIVDDDHFVITALEKKIEWEQLPIIGIYTAYNIRQAKKIIQEQPIHIMLCDIEMSQGTGLDLLEWVREHNYPIQTIFLTSHADFRYAQQALQLNSLDYFVKPVDFRLLTQGIQKAVKKVREENSLQADKTNSDSWKKNYRNMIDLFWEKYFHEFSYDVKMLSKKHLYKELENRTINYTEHDIFLPIYLVLSPKNSIIEEMGKSTFDFSFKNITQESLSTHCIYAESFTRLSPYEWIILLKDISLEVIRCPLETSCNILADNLYRFLQCETGCAIAPETSLPGVADSVKSLQAILYNNIGQPGKIIFQDQYIYKSIPYQPPSLELLQTYLEHNDTNAALTMVDAYLNQLIADNMLSKEILSRLKLDLEQLLFAYLMDHEIQAHTLFSTEESSTLKVNSARSFYDMKQYLNFLIQETIRYTCFISEEESVTDIVLKHIHKHYQEDLTRTSLADMVYLNPDYLSRLFKKRTNTSIINYITEYRIEKAKELLANQNLPVNVIASQTGYGNYSYFSKIFKENVGCTPNAYRKQLLSEQNNR